MISDLITHYTGYSNPGWAALWGGFISDIPIIAGIWMLARKHNCHTHRCWRLGKHAVEGTSYITCRKHHPTIDGKVSAAQIHAAHIIAKKGHHGSQ